VSSHAIWRALNYPDATTIERENCGQCDESNTAVESNQLK